MLGVIYAEYVGNVQHIVLPTVAKRPQLLFIFVIFLSH
jgi:hypothetical protein